MIHDKKMVPKPNPIKKEEEVQQNTDEHIDQDFPGFPHPPSDKKTITGQAGMEKKPADNFKKRPKE